MTSLLEKTIGEALREQAAKNGDKEFMVFPNRGVRYTFGDMYRKSGELAKGLLAAGFKKGGHIGIWSYNTPEWATVFYAAARLGILVVPININCRQQEIGFILAHADIDALFMIDKFRDTDLVEMLREVIPELKCAGADKLNSPQFPRLTMVTVFGASPCAEACRLEALINKGKQLDDQALQAAEAGVTSKDTAAIMYTSGTTGFPKGAMLTHRNLINNGYCANRFQVLNGNAIILNPLPFFYITSLTGSLIESLVYGYKIVALEGFDVQRCLEFIPAEQCSWIFGVPTMYLAMINHPQFASFNMESVEYACIGGAVCPPELLRKIMDAMRLKGLYLAYGLTDTSPFITDVIIKDPSDSRLATVGDPIPGVEVSIRSFEDGAECPAGTQGEICTRGHNVMQGYYKMEDATKETIDREGWLHTGDLGRLLPNGCLIIDGRIKELIIRGGENVYPKELENLLLSLPAVRDAQVAGIPSEKYGEEVGAFIILKPGKAISAEEIKTFCKDKISRYKTPQYVFFVEAFPLSGNGKVQKWDCGNCGKKTWQPESKTEKN